MIEVTDALGRSLRLPGPARRVVSLVPSETETVARLVGVRALVGRTSFCVEPAGEIEAVPVVGGTKDLDVQTVVAQEPDLVLANKEENAQGPVRRLLDAGLPVHVSFPRDVAESVRYVKTVSGLLGADGDEAERLQHAFDAAEAALTPQRVRVFVPVWKDPWMTFNGETFASDILDLSGGENIFSDRPRRYPLAADLGAAAPLPAERVGDRDTRYPRVTLEEVRQRRPDLVLLPDEPFDFQETHARELAAALQVPCRLCDGKQLFWYGSRVAEALPALRHLLHG